MRSRFTICRGARTPRPKTPCGWRSCLAVLAIAWTAVPALAQEPDDGESGSEEACEIGDEPEAPDPAPSASPPVRVSTDGLYDLEPLSSSDPTFAALRAAHARRQWGVVRRLAVEIVEKNTTAQVQQAALMLQATGEEAQRHWSEAERVWRRLAQSGVLAQRARLRLADLALRRQDVGEALVQLAAVAPWHVRRDEATLTMARLELERGNMGPARDALDRLDPGRLRSAERALYFFARGEISRRSGHLPEAAALYRQSWLLDHSPTSDRAAQRLAECDLPLSAADQIERILRRRELKSSQIKAWLREADAVAAHDAGLRLYAQGSLWMRSKAARAKALDALTKATEQLTEPLLLARAIYRLADGLGKSGDDAAAIALLGRVPEILRDQSDQAATEVQARSLARLHRLYSSIDRPAEAAEALQRLVDLHPSAGERELAVWGLGWQRFLAGDSQKALKLFVELERGYGHLWTGAQQPWRAKAIYWQARCLQQLGQTQTALDAWATVTNTWPQTYYGVMSLDRIAEVDQDRAARLQGPPPSPADGKVSPLSLDRLRVDRSVALDEAALLVRMSLLGEARALLREQLSRGLPRDGVHLLATLYEMDGQPRQAFRVMSRHTRRAARPDDSTVPVWRQSFPQAFLEDVNSSTQLAGIARSTLYAVVRHESAFVPTAISRAGAYGLVQALPAVARNVLELYGLPYGGPRSLLRPAENLQVGSLYLAQLLSFFRGNLPVAAAAYNAGPYAARGWVKRWASLPTDVFVENIPYPATRAYVMQVTASAQTYAWLYPEWQELAAGQLARSQHLPQSFGPFMQRPAPASAARSN